MLAPVRAGISYGPPRRPPDPRLCRGDAASTTASAHSYTIHSFDEPAGYTGIGDKAGSAGAEGKIRPLVHAACRSPNRAARTKMLDAGEVIGKLL